MLILAIVASCIVCLRRGKKPDKDSSVSELPATAAAVEAQAGGPDAKHLSAATTLTPGSPGLYPAPQTYSQSQTQMHQYSHPHVPEMGAYSNSHRYSPAFGHGQAQIVQDQYGGIYSILPAGMPAVPNYQQQPYPYQYNSPRLATGPHGGGYLPGFQQPPPAPAPVQLYAYQPNQMNQPNADYQQQYSRPPPNIVDPVEADSGSFRPSSLSTSQPRLSTTTAVPPASHGRTTSANQPTTSVNSSGGQSAAELSSHGGSSGRLLIPRKSVPSRQDSNPP